MSKLRLIAAFLALVMVLGVLGSLSILPVYAAEAAKTDKKEEEEEEEVIDYINEVYKTPEDKLAMMEKRIENFGYELYIEPYTAEVAVKNQATGQILFTNPYSVGSSYGSDDTKSELLSQIIIKYMDNDKELYFDSFREAAQRNQIIIKNIKNGLRVEYTLGREEKRKLVPKLIEASRFQTLILDNIDSESAIKKMEAFYQLKDPNDPKLTERGKKELQGTFPITKTMAVYVFDPYASDRELNQIEGYIKQYCPNYTYETLDEDHAMTEYEGQDKAPPLFKLALEYYLDEQGLSVRQPANGIRYDESQYKLTNVNVLPYIGAGSSEYKGYTFIPDGSGTLIRFEDVKEKYGKSLTLTGKMYGQDYAYHKIGGAHQQVMRLPIYGVVENYVTKQKIESEVEVEGYTDDFGDWVEPTTKTVTETKEIQEDRGFLAIIEEGDALAEISTQHGGTLHLYNSVQTTFYPRPRDSYNLGESMSVGANATWTVESTRKYVGSYRVRFIMLTDETIAKDKKLDNTYEASWLGMAKAYRDYLVKKEVLKPLEKTDRNIPLYVESFGTIYTQEKILSIPVSVKTPLTTFEDLKTMYTQLKEVGIDNVNFRLQGFANNGMVYTAPYNANFESKVGGDKGFEDFVSYAASNNILVFPDFDFVYQNYKKPFDGFSYRKHAVKTMDNRYTQKRFYDVAWQTFFRGNLNVVSPSVFEYFYEHFNEDYSKFGANAVSAATLGADLNSDFDKKDPYNREDSKEFTVEILQNMQKDYANVMVDSGNSYALPYANHILNVALDSSGYTYASEAVPFAGVVLHGYKNFTGTPINMAGDINYMILKTIENGADPYFTLSYRNTAELKEYFDLSKYYSVAYDIWFDDVVEKYNLLNDALKDVQNATIEDHQFLIAERIPSAEELAADKVAEDALEKEEAEEEAKKAEKAERKEALEKRKATEAGEEYEAPVVKEKEEKAEEDDGEYKVTKYTVDNGRVVKVTYSTGKSFLLNYNNYAVTVDGMTIDALSFVIVK